MAMTRSGVKNAAKKKLSKLILSSVKLEKAQFFVVDKKTGRRSSPIKVQFNPSEYSVSRGAKIKQRQGIGQEGKLKHTQIPSGNLATLSMTLYFDDISDVEPTWLPLPIAVGNIKNPGSKSDMLIELMKIVQDEHAPYMLEFSWGAMSFSGYVVSNNVSYTMFDPDGTPVKCKMSISIQGEETKLLAKSKAMPPESPDRTKERRLGAGEQLWSMAYEEYDDPSMWKVIAEANGITNPRRVSRTMLLKVPSID